MLKPLKNGRQPERKYASIGAWHGQEEFLISLLLRANTRLQTTFDRCFMRFGMTAQEAAVLVHCVEAEGISAGRLAEAMGRDKSNITRFVDRLEASGFLTRKSDPHDRRLLIINATARGRRVAPRLRIVFDEVRKRVLEGILTDDIERLGSVLSQLYANAARLHGGNTIGKLPKNAPPQVFG